MKIGILGGAGAMGGVFGAALAGGGHDVTLIDVSAEAVERIGGEGLRVEDKTGAIRIVRLAATTRPAGVDPLDLIVNFVKCYHTEAAVSAVRPAIGPDTVILTLQNGWGNAETISRIVGPERVIVGLTYHSATLLGPGHVKHSGTGITHVGEIGGPASERVRRVVNALESAGFEAVAADDILAEIWKKLTLNAATLPVSALLSFFAHELVEHEGTLAEMRAITEEVAKVAAAQDIPLDLEERWEAITGLLKRAVGGKGSMLQDVQAKRRTEIDVINGAIVRAGEKHGVPTPHNQAMVNMVRALEAAYLQQASLRKVS